MLAALGVDTVLLFPLLLWGGAFFEAVEEGSSLCECGYCCDEGAVVDGKDCGWGGARALGAGDLADDECVGLLELWLLLRYDSIVAVAVLLLLEGFGFLEEIGIDSVGVVLFLRAARFDAGAPLPLPLAFALASL